MLENIIIQKADESNVIVLINKNYYEISLHKKSFNKQKLLWKRVT